MNILIVDDQKEITESLKNGIRWGELLVEQVYTACSAKEAKLIMVNFAIDLLLSDIEMPEEDGLQLFQWVKKKFPDIKCIFITSHAEFEYARNALQLGGFDYILQPARFKDIEAVINRAREKIEKEREIRKLENTRKLVIKQRDNILEAVFSKLRQNKQQEAEQIFIQFIEMFRLEYKEAAFFTLAVHVTSWNRDEYSWNEELVWLVFRNVLEEIFINVKGKTCIYSLSNYKFAILLVAEKSLFNEEQWQLGLKRFYSFLKKHMDCSISMYVGKEMKSPFAEQLMKLLEPQNNSYMSENKGIYTLTESVRIEKGDADEMPINKAIDYIRANLNKNISRSDVANHVHLNEEYFSRLFKQYTGETFKDYLQIEKMKMARNLLEHSNLSISIIASKVGYDNFSHFSKMFKKVVDKSPQEYRKEKRS